MLAAITLSLGKKAFLEACFEPPCSLPVEMVDCPAAMSADFVLPGILSFIKPLYEFYVW